MFSSIRQVSTSLPNSARLCATTDDHTYALKVRQTFPGATTQTINALQTKDSRLDARPEVAQLAIHPQTPRHSLNLETPLLVEGDILDLTGTIGSFET